MTCCIGRDRYGTRTGEGRTISLNCGERSYASTQPNRIYTGEHTGCIHRTGITERDCRIRSRRDVGEVVKCRDNGSGYRHGPQTRNR